MLESQNHYQCIAKAIGYIRENFKQQPSLNEVAEFVNLSPFHFQRVFTQWAGVSPKKFMQFLSIEYAKKLLNNPHANLLDTAFETGLSGTSRLHDLFVNIEGMTPGEYKNHGAALTINYHFTHSPFGEILVASTAKGVCHMMFVSDQDIALNELKARFSEAQYYQTTDQIQQDALCVFQQDYSGHLTEHAQIKLHLKGSAFQLKVWQALLDIPLGDLSNYGNVARNIDNPKASRAVGTAIGANNVAFLIPCHRVIKADGVSGDYRWGGVRKSAIIGWEGAKCL